MFDQVAGDHLCHGTCLEWHLLGITLHEIESTSHPSKIDVGVDDILAFNEGNEWIRTAPTSHVQAHQLPLPIRIHPPVFHVLKQSEILIGCAVPAEPLSGIHSTP